MTTATIDQPTKKPSSTPLVSRKNEKALPIRDGKVRSTQKLKFEGVFIKLPSGRYAKFPSAVKAKCGVVDKTLHDTIISSFEELKAKSKDERRSICLSLVNKTGWNLNLNGLWNLLVTHSEDRCTMFQNSKRAEHTANPNGYTLAKLLSDVEILALQDPPMRNQAKQVLLILTSYCREHKTLTFSENKAKDLMHQHQDQLKTKQDPFRIFRYYRPTLVSLKLLRQAA